MGRRQTVDEETAAIATERLARLLGDLAPRRAADVAPDPGVDRPTARDGTLPTGRVTRSAAIGEDLEEESAERTRPPSEARSASFDPQPRRTEAASRWSGSIARRGQLRAFGRRHLGVIAVLLVIGIGAAGWALLRARPVAEAVPLTLTSTQRASGPSAGSAAGSAATPQSSGSRASGAAPSGADQASSGAAPRVVVVHVIGAVRRPGVVTLGEPARVQDAILAAGGLTSTARPGELNLAQILTDGEQVVIGSARDPGGEVREGMSGSGDATGSGPAAGSGADRSGAAGSAGAIVDLNTATSAQLDTLPGVGPVTAERIVAWRTEHGQFSRIEELQEVDGIGPKTYAQIAPHVRV